MSLSGVANDVGSMSKSLTTNVTLERFLSRVSECMKLQPFIPSEHFTTCFAAKFLYVAVGTAVTAEVGAVRESPPTDLASVWLRLAVGCHVCLQLALSGEDLSTGLASVGLSHLVDLVTVLPQPFLGGEDLPTLVALMVIGMYKLNMLLQHSFVFKWREAELTTSVPVSVSDVHGYFAQGAELNSTLTARVTCRHLWEHIRPTRCTCQLLQHGVCGVERVRHRRLGGLDGLLHRQHRQTGHWAKLLLHLWIALHVLFH